MPFVPPRLPAAPEAQRRFATWAAGGAMVSWLLVAAGVLVEGANGDFALWLRPLSFVALGLSGLALYGDFARHRGRAGASARVRAASLVLGGTAALVAWYRAHPGFGCLSGLPQFAFVARHALEPHAVATAALLVTALGYASALGGPRRRVAAMGLGASLAALAFEGLHAEVSRQLLAMGEALARDRPYQPAFWSLDEMAIAAAVVEATLLVAAGWWAVRRAWIDGRSVLRAEVALVGSATAVVVIGAQPPI